MQSVDYQGFRRWEKPIAYSGVLEAQQRLRRMVLDPYRDQISADKPLDDLIWEVANQLHSLIACLRGDLNAAIEVR